MYPPPSRIALRASNRQRFFARLRCVGEQPIFSHLPVPEFPVDQQTRPPQEILKFLLTSPIYAPKNGNVAYTLGK